MGAVQGSGKLGRSSEIIGRTKRGAGLAGPKASCGLGMAAGKIPCWT